MSRRRVFSEPSSETAQPKLGRNMGKKQIVISSTRITRLPFKTYKLEHNLSNKASWAQNRVQLNSSRSPNSPFCTSKLPILAYSNTMF
jgi:hypothetical protein